MHSVYTIPEGGQGLRIYTISPSFHFPPLGSVSPCICGKLIKCPPLDRNGWLVMFLSLTITAFSGLCNACPSQSPPLHSAHLIPIGLLPASSCPSLLLSFLLPNLFCVQSEPLFTYTSPLLPMKFRMKSNEGATSFLLNEPERSVLLHHPHSFVTD